MPLNCVMLHEYEPNTGMRGFLSAAMFTKLGRSLNQTKQRIASSKSQPILLTTTELSVASNPIYHPDGPHLSTRIRTNPHSNTPSAPAD